MKGSGRYDRGLFLCAQAAPDLLQDFGAGGGNRTRISCLEGKGLTITQRPRYAIGIRPPRRKGQGASEAEARYPRSHNRRAIS